MPSKDNAARTAPKLGASPPSTGVPAAQRTAGEEARERRRNRDRSHGESHRKSRDDDSGRGHHHRRHPRHVSRSPARSPPKDERPAVTEPSQQRRQGEDSSAEKLFVIDRRGDPLILRYGSNDRSRVPSYRRFGGGEVLGSREKLTIRRREGGGEEFFAWVPRERVSIFRDPALLLRLARRPSRRVRQAGEGDGLKGGEEFVPLKSAHKRKREEGDGHGSEEEDEDGPSYRSIHGKAKRHEYSDSDLDYDSEDSAGFGEGVGMKKDPTKEKSMELSRQVKENPEDVGSWLELVDLQESLFAIENDGRAPTKDEIEGITDLKISLLESALSKVTVELDRQRLLIRLMQEASKVWTAKQLSARWQDLVEDVKGSFELWRHRLDFEMTNMSTYTFESMKGFFLERIQSLKGRLVAESLAPEPDHSPICQQLIYVFLRATRWLQESGFAELATAAWQAELELTFARPTSLAEPTDEALMASFRDFWENEMPRIGEPNARGWMGYAAAPDVAVPPDPKHERAISPPASRDAYKAWAAIEQQKADAAWMPARTLDVDSEADPFRLVMFSDIEEWLIAIPATSLEALKPVLIDAFLIFCRLPPALESSDWIKSARTDSFLATSTVSPGQQDVKTDRPAFSHENSLFSISPDVLFGGSAWFTYLPTNLRTPTDTGPFAVEAVRQLAQRFGAEVLAEYCLAMEWIVDPTTIKKAARSLLKLYPANMALYNAYALAEQANGNMEVARRVLTSATGQTPSASRMSSIPLWQTWAWMELEAGNKELAVARLCASVDAEPSETPINEEPVSPAQLLKARQKTHSTRDYLLSAGDITNAAQYAHSLILLEYLTAPAGTEAPSPRQGNLPAALHSLSTFTTALSARGLAATPAHERLLQSAARLLHGHAQRGPHRAADLQAALLGFARAFPANTLFLGLLAWASPVVLRLLDDPVHAALQRGVLGGPHDGVAVRAVAVRREGRVGNGHSTRAAFEEAVGSVACRGCVGLWIGYVRFCSGSKELRPRAKEVFYRALAACPWSKGLAMEAFTTLFRDMESGELRAVFSTLQAKGLRVHVDMEEFAAKWREKYRVVATA